MKQILTLFLLVSILAGLLCGQTIRYVDNRVSSSGNGQSWATAWKNLSNINWSDLSGGGILYVSGGNDSLIYNENFPTCGVSGTSGNYVRIFPGKLSPNPSGHSGAVIIDGQDVRGPQIHFENGSCGSMSYVWLKGMTFRRSNGNAIYAHCDVNYLILDSLYITDFRDDGINIIGNDDYYLTENGVCAEHITITNCIIKSYTNNVGHEDNCIYVQMVANLNINNTISHQRNKQIGVSYPNHEHIDPLQTHVVRGVKLYNNVFVLDSSVMGHGMILGVQSRPGRLDTVIIYNNYIYADGHLWADGNPYINGFVTRWYGYVNSVYPPTYVIHNTVATSNGGENTILQEYGIDVFVNNIVCQFGTNGEDPANYGGLGLDAFASSWNGDQCYVDSCRGNVFWNEWTNNMKFGGNQFVGHGGSPTGAPSNWNDWVNNYGGTGVNANPLFTNNVKIGDINRLDISSSSPAIDAGVSEWWESWIESKGLPTTDIHGNPRDWSNPDAGAMEYQSGVADTVPNSFPFTDVTNATRSTLYTSNLVTLTGFDSAYAYAGGYEYQINSGSWRTGYTKVFNNDNARVRLTSSGNYNTAVSRTLTVGGRSDTYTVTTGSAPPSGNGKLLKSADGKVTKDANGNKIIVRF